MKLFFDKSKNVFYSGTGDCKKNKKINELKTSLHPYLSASVLNELLIEYGSNASAIWPQFNSDALQSIMSSSSMSNFEFYLEKGCQVVTSEASGIEPFLLYATNKYKIQHSMGGARPEMFHKRFDCVEFLEEDPETRQYANKHNSASIVYIKCTLNVFNTLTKKYNSAS